MQENFVEDFTGRLLGALRQFDTDYAPYGLYASNEPDEPPQGKRISPYREWDMALKPFLTGEAVIIKGSNFRPPVARFGISGVGTVQIELHRLSKIKVRQYGSRYYVDKHVAFSERWAEIALEDKIRRLWKRSDYNFLHMGVMVLIGFDKAADPLRPELAALEDEVKWAKHGVVHTSVQWPDVYGRGFSVILSAWARYSEEGISWR